MSDSNFRYITHYGFSGAFTSLFLGDIKLFDMQLATIQGRRVENTATRHPNDMGVVASPDYQGTGELAEQSIAEVILQQ